MQSRTVNGLFSNKAYVLAPELEVLIDAQGNTPLHDLVRDCNDSSKIVSLIANVGSRTVERMARTVNNKGQLPVDIMIERTVDNKTKNAINILLTTLIKTNPLKQLSDNIDSATVLEQYSFSPDSEIYRNMQIACAIANETRRAITTSTSHPQINNADNNEFTALSIELNEIRTDTESLTAYTILSHPFDYIFNPEDLLNEKIAEQLLAHHLGNCYEFAMVARYLLKKRYSNMTAKIYEVSNGDHTFLVIGERDNAVVCDAWAGEVYPMCDIPHRLRCFKHYTVNSSHINVITSYNPVFHVIKPNTRLEHNRTSFKILLMSFGLLLTNVFCEALANHPTSPIPQMK